MDAPNPQPRMILKSASRLEYARFGIVALIVFALPDDAFANQWILDYFAGLPQKTGIPITTGTSKGVNYVIYPSLVKDATCTGSYYCYQVIAQDYWTGLPDPPFYNDQRVGFVNVTATEQTVDGMYGASIITIGDSNSNNQKMDVFLSKVTLIPNWPQWQDYGTTNMDGITFDAGWLGHVYAEDLTIKNWAEAAVDVKPLTFQTVRMHTEGNGLSTLKLWRAGPHYIVDSTINNSRYIDTLPLGDGGLISTADCSKLIVYVYNSTFNGSPTLPLDRITCWYGEGTPVIIYLDHDPKLTGEMHPMFTSPGTAPSTAPGPTATISASSLVINSGESATLSWNSTDSNKCVGTNFSTGNALSGSLAVSPRKNTTYTLTCMGAGGTISKQLNITVVPIVTLAASPASISWGQSSTLSWSSAAAKRCTGSNFDTNWTEQGSVTVSPTKSTTYTLTCDGAGGIVSKHVTVTVVGTATPPPAATLYANFDAINAGKSSMLTWSSANSMSCTGTGFSTGGALSGSFLVSAARNTTYSVTCTGAAGSASKQATVRVYPVDEPIASIWANPSSYTPGTNQHSTINWTSSNAESCMAEFLEASVTGSATVSPTRTTNYTVACINYLTGEIAVAPQTTVTVPGSPPPPAPPSVTLSAHPATVDMGKSSTLIWSSRGASSCTSINFNAFGARSGTDIVTPGQATKYTLICIGTGGSSIKQTTVTHRDRGRVRP